MIRGSGKIAESYETEYGMDAPEWDMISSDIKSMRIEGKITRVSDYFSGISGLPNMTSLKLSKHIKQIGQGAFRSSAKLKSVKLKNGLKRIQKDAFANSGLREISIPKSVKKIEDSVFRGCDKLKKVSFAEGVEKTGQLMFWGCNNLKKVELPKSLKVIERSCFLATGLERITIPENVEEIGDLSFAQSSTKKAKLKEVTIKSKKITKWGKD
nr:leucine-rich repeat domain-containing protein [Eubacterium sp.]